jgi:hypothetical protein
MQNSVSIVDTLSVELRSMCHRYCAKPMAKDALKKAPNPFAIQDIRVSIDSFRGFQENKTRSR